MRVIQLPRMRVTRLLVMMAIAMLLLMFAENGNGHDNDGRDGSDDDNGGDDDECQRSTSPCQDANFMFQLLAHHPRGEEKAGISV